MTRPCVVGSLLLLCFCFNSMFNNHLICMTLMCHIPSSFISLDSYFMPDIFCRCLCTIHVDFCFDMEAHNQLIYKLENYTSSVGLIFFIWLISRRAQLTRTHLHLKWENFSFKKESRFEPLDNMIVVPWSDSDTCSVWKFRSSMPVAFFYLSV